MTSANWLDRAIEAVSPSWALARARDRAILQSAQGILSRGGYEGARADWRGSSWRPEPGGPNTSLYGDLQHLRNRARSLVRNNPLAKRSINILTAHTVGTGIRPSWPKASKSSRARLKSEWERFVDNADARGQVDAYGLQEQAVRGMFEGGETLALRETRRKGGQGYLRYLLIEGEQLDHNREGVFEGHPTRLGVALDKNWHEVAGYWLFPQNPSDALLWGVYPYSKFVPAEGIVHLYRIRRPGQMRGVPELAASLQVMRDLADYTESALVKARIEACFSAFVTSQDDRVGTLAQRKDERGRNFATLSPGMIQRLDQGEDIKFAQPTTSSDFGSFLLHSKMEAASGAGVTYDQATGDLRQANYSSLRAGKVEFKREVEMLQHLTVIPQYCKPIYRAFERFSADFGRLKPVDLEIRPEWVTPAWEPIDPKKDLEADILAVRSGRLSLGEFIAGWGRDPHEQIEEIAEFNRLIDEFSLTLDTDPRKVARAGQAQPDPQADPASPAPAQD